LLEKFLDWSWDPNQDNWQESYNNLLAALETRSIIEVETFRNGGLARSDGKLKKLAAWISAQKRNYACWQNIQVQRKTRYPKLLPAQIEMLEALPGWSWNRREENWLRNYQVLVKYISDKSFDSVTPETRLEGCSIGRWVSKQRQLIKLGKLAEEKRDMLEKIGWIQSPYDDQWNLNYRLLLEYLEVNGDAYVPQKCVFSGVNLGAWVSTQRSSYKNRKLDHGKINKLELLAGWKWDAGDQAAHSISKVKNK